MSAHTPGPWLIHKPDHVGDKKVYAAHEQTFDLATVHDGGTPEVDANAHLIAAAPELAEALKDTAEILRAFVAYYIHDHKLGLDPDGTPEVLRAQAALSNAASVIDKAEGRQ